MAKLHLGSLGRRTLKAALVVLLLAAWPVAIWGVWKATRADTLRPAPQGRHTSPEDKRKREERGRAIDEALAEVEAKGFSRDEIAGRLTDDVLDRVDLDGICRDREAQ